MQFNFNAVAATQQDRHKDTAGSHSTDMGLWRIHKYNWLLSSFDKVYVLQI